MNEMGGAYGKWQTKFVHAGSLLVDPEGKRPFGKPRRRWEYDIKMDLRGMGGVVWANLAQDRDRWRALVNVTQNFQVL
jgi:hypothetical protein